MSWRTIGNIAQYSVGGPLYGWPNYATHEIESYIAQRGKEAKKFHRPPAKAAPTFQFKADATVESNVERALIVARGVSGVVVKETLVKKAAATNLSLGHFFPTAAAMPTGQGNRIGV